MLMTTHEIADYLDMNYCTLTNYLGNYRFSKYRKGEINPIRYNVTEEFLNTLYDFIKLKLDRKARGQLKAMETIKERIANEF